MSVFANSAKLILSLLSSHGNLSQKEISYCSNIPKRTVRYNLNKLLEKQLVEEKPNLSDLRFKVYSLKGEKAV